MTTQPGQAGQTDRPRRADEASPATQGNQPEAAGSPGPPRPQPAERLRLPPLDTHDDPRDLWDEFFARHDPDLEQIRIFALRLHRQKQYEHVIALLETSLIHGKAQPWIYEVLALTMEIAGRPKAQVERVLLSRIDFTAADVPSMLYSAAYLTRFGATAQALRLYRQASQIEPHRPEPYVLGLKLAREQKDYEAVQWAAVGILSTGWVRDHETLHRQAEDAALEARQALLKAGRDEEAEALAAAVAEARQRDLVVRLSWAGDGDLDLLVEEPVGTICSAENRWSPGGGVLVREGHGPNPANCVEEYVCTFGVPGSYRLRIKHVWGNVVGSRAQLTVIRYQGTSDESVQTFSVPIDKEEKVVRITLENGRRIELAPVPRGELTWSHEPRRRRGSPMAGRDPGARRAARSFAESQQLRAGQVGFQPIISVIGDGVGLGGLSVVSGDRRYVRMGVNPSFTNLIDVFTFTFQGAPPGNQNGGN